MEYKTCEERVLGELEQAENQVAELKNEITYASNIINATRQFLWIEVGKVDGTFTLKSKAGDLATFTSSDGLYKILAPIYLKNGVAGVTTAKK